MRSLQSLCVLAGIVLFESSLPAATLPASISPRSQFVTGPPKGVSIGANFESITREIIRTDKNDAVTLEARSCSAYIAWELLGCYTFFATAGRSEARLPDWNNYGNSKLKWSVGFEANLLQMNVPTPSLIAGRILVKPTAEFSRYGSSGSDGNIRWVDFFAAIPVSYEILAKRPPLGNKEFHSLALYAGPVFSYLDGNIKKGTDEIDLGVKDEFGAIGGVDLRFFENLSIGGHIQYFGNSTFGASLRYHF